MLLLLARAIYRRCRDYFYLFKAFNICSFGFKYAGSTRRFLESSDESGLIVALTVARSSCNRLVNVGANAGFYAILADSLGFSVLAFEPEYYMFKRLLYNIRINDCMCIPIPLALSSENVRSDFYGSGTAGTLIPGISGNLLFDRQRVTCIKPDDIILANSIAFDFWILDCEGSEFKVIEGAHKLLKDTIPIIALEYLPSRSSSESQSLIGNLIMHEYNAFLSSRDIAIGIFEMYPIVSLSSLPPRASTDNLVFVSSQWHLPFLDNLKHRLSLDVA